MSDEIKDVQNAQEESQQIDEQTRDEKEGILKDLDGKKAKKKREKKNLTPEQKKRKTIKALIITGSVVLALAIFFSGCAIASTVNTNAHLSFASSFEKVEYTEHDQLAPTFDDELGYWTFTKDADREFKVLQFTDVHIGGGAFSGTKDNWAMSAVATMIRQSQPDLVVVTGDIAYPVPFQAGTFNNLNATRIFSNMMESLGVYWTFAFGNHDTELYSLYGRDQICDYYANAGFKYCLFRAGFCDEKDYIGNDARGFGNDVIVVKNPAESVNPINQALVTATATPTATISALPGSTTTSINAKSTGTQPRWTSSKPQTTASKSTTSCSSTFLLKSTATLGQTSSNLANPPTSLNRIPLSWAKRARPNLSTALWANPTRRKTACAPTAYSAAAARTRFLKRDLLTACKAYSADTTTTTTSPSTTRLPAHLVPSA